jgi:hypothetical protein
MVGWLTLLDLTRSSVACVSTDWVLGSSHSPAPSHPRFLVFLGVLSIRSICIMVIR